MSQVNVNEGGVMDDATRIKRGFEYDTLTEADDNRVARVRDRIYSNPCGEGVWVSIQTGKVYRGNGGNEREQSLWYSQGPWVRISADPGYDEQVSRVARLAQKLDALRDAMTDLVEGSA